MVNRDAGFVAIKQRYLCQIAHELCFHIYYQGAVSTIGRSMVTAAHKLLDQQGQFNTTFLSPSIIEGKGVFVIYIKVARKTQAKLHGCFFCACQNFCGHHHHL